ncbi:hypothetical protein DY000_02046768 [Brassica cretica]|uniref:Uncharacterized protein n=1 Tax=Brassica cretica TaxID=69181 RepID=A0ABQ7F3P4_BRACR|nr:hypothetical protein DY000_02046768 [Brassica cretica]
MLPASSYWKKPISHVSALKRGEERSILRESNIEVLGLHQQSLVVVCGPSSVPVIQHHDRGPLPAETEEDTVIWKRHEFASS